MLSKSYVVSIVYQVNAVDTKIPSTDRLVTKAQYDLGKQDHENKVKDAGKKIRNTSGLVKTGYNIKVAD